MQSEGGALLFAKGSALVEPRIMQQLEAVKTGADYARLFLNCFDILAHCSLLLDSELSDSTKLDAPFIRTSQPAGNAHPPFEDTQNQDRFPPFPASPTGRASSLSCRQSSDNPQIGRA